MSAPIRIGVVGAGAVAQVAHLPVLARTDGVEVVAICDNDRMKANALAQRFDIANVFDDIEDLLQHTEPDGVVVCTPNHLHGIHTETALSAGAHVLCERPLGLSVDEVQRVIAADARSDRHVTVGMNYRYRNDVQALRRCLEQGELGSVHAVRGGWYTFRPSRQALGWRRHRDQSGGGAMLDLGLGLIDLSMWLTGCPDARFVTASTVGGGDGSVEDSGCALIQCEGGITVLVDVSWHWVGEAETFWFGVHGSDGSATISPLRVFKEMHGAAVNVTPTGASERETPFMSSYSAEWANYLAVIRGNIAPPDLGDQLAVHKVMAAVYRSAEERNTIDLSPSSAQTPSPR